MILSNTASPKLRTTGAILASTSWVVPANVYGILVNAVAGGGGGARRDSSMYTGGGAGGHVLDFPISVTPGETLTLTVGAAGAGTVVTSGNTTAGTGGATTIARGATVLLNLGGGAGGKIVSSLPYGGGGGYPNGSGGGAYKTDGTSTKAGGLCGYAAQVNDHSGAQTVVSSSKAYGPLPGGVGTGARTPFPSLYGAGGNGHSDTSSVNNGYQGVIYITWVEFNV